MSAEQRVGAYTEDGHRIEITIGLNSANRVVVTTPGVIQLDAVADVAPFVEAVRLAAELAVDRMKRSL